MEKTIFKFGLFLFVFCVLVSCGRGGSAVKAESEDNQVAECTAKAEGGFVAGNTITIDAGKNSTRELNHLIYTFKIVSPSNEEKISEKQSAPFYKFIPKETGFYDVTVVAEDLAETQSSARLQLFVESLKIFGCLPTGNQASVNVKELIWQCNGGHDTRFNVYFYGENDSPLLLEEMVEKKSCPLSKELPYGDKFIWKVEAENNGCKTEAQNWFRTAEDNGPPYISISLPERKYFVGNKVELGVSIEDAEGDKISTVRWELKTKPLGSNAHFSKEGGNTNFFEPDFSGDYTVIVYAADEYGHIGRSSIIIPVEDIEFFNISPGNNANGLPCSNVVLSWDCSDEKAALEIKFAECQDFGSAQWKHLENVNEYSTGNLEQGTAYCWALKIGSRIFPEEGKWKFTTATTDVPAEKLYLTMVYPVEGDSNIPVNAVMIWESNGSKFNVYIGESEGTMINVSQRQTCKEFDLTSLDLGFSRYYVTRIDSERGSELLQGNVIKFKTAEAFPPPPGGPDWRGDDISMWKSGKLEIAKYKDHLDASGQKSLLAGAVPEARGDFNCWNNCGVSVKGVMVNGVLTVDITKIPLLKGANRINVITGVEGWTQLHLFSEKDKTILVRRTSASSSSGAGELVMGIYLLDDGTYSPVPDGVSVVAR